MFIQLDFLEWKCLCYMHFPVCNRVLRGLTDKVSLESDEGALRQVGCTGTADWELLKLDGVSFALWDRDLVQV